MRQAIYAMCLTALWTLSLSAQTFESASVKRSQPNDLSGSTFEYLLGGGLRVKNGTLRGLIESAYDVREFQILDGPQWLDTERFDVLARSQSNDRNPTPSANQITTTRLKLRAVLADRFALTVHHETRDIQEYALIIDGKGPKLNAEAPTPAQNPRSGVQASCGHITATSASMANLTVYLSRQLKRPVVDRTGINGRFNFELDWRPELTPCADVTDSAPSIFTALRERLGLRLDSIKGPVEVVVVDHAARPSDD